MPNWSDDDGRCYWRSPGEEYCCQGGRGCPMHDSRWKERRRPHDAFCASSVADVCCTLHSGHVGPCSFHLHDEKADAVIHGLRARIAELEAELEAADSRAVARPGRPR